MSKKEKILLISIMCVAGMGMHSVYDLLSGGILKTALGLIAPCNETVWEHMKLFWYPFLAAGIVLSVRKRDKGYFSGMVAAGIASMLLQIGIFTFYQSLTGISILILDIVFYLVDMVLCALAGLLFAQQTWAKKYSFLFVIIAAAVTALIIYLTFNPGTGYVFMDDTGLVNII